MKATERTRRVIAAQEVAISLLVLSHPKAEEQAPVLYKDSVKRIEPTTREEPAASVVFNLPWAKDGAALRFPSQAKVFDGTYQSLPGLRKLEYGQSALSPCPICLDEMREVTLLFDRNIVVRRCVRHSTAGFARYDFRQVANLYFWPCESDRQFGIAVASFEVALGVSAEPIPLEGAFNRRSRHCLGRHNRC
jgi:hypothetical protein